MGRTLISPMWITIRGLLLWSLMEVSKLPGRDLLIGVWLLIFSWYVCFWYLFVIIKRFLGLLCSGRLVWILNFVFNHWMYVKILKFIFCCIIEIQQWYQSHLWLIQSNFLLFFVIWIRSSSNYVKIRFFDWYLIHVLDVFL